MWNSYIDIHTNAVANSIMLLLCYDMIVITVFVKNIVNCM